MADETKGGQVGAVWMRLGLKADDLKKKLGEVGEQIKESIDDKPVEDFNKEAKKTEGIAEGLGNKFESLAKTILAAFAVNTVREFLNECEDLAQVQQYAEQKLAITMQNRFNATQKEIQAVSNLANQLESVSGIADQITLSGANSLATYVESAEIVEGMLPVMQAIANNRFGFGEITSEDFTDIGKTLGEVFAEGALEPLKSMNIGISAEDSEAFKALNTEAERLAYITDLVRSRVGDVNGLLSETLTIDRQLSTSTNELKETIGSIYQVFIVPIKSMLVSITNSVNSALSSLASVLGVKMVQATSATDSAASSTSNYFKEATEEANELKKAIMGFDVIQKLNLTTDSSDASSTLDAIAGSSGGAITQGVKFEYEEGGFADRIVTALSKIGQGISDYIGDKFGIAFDEENIEGFVSKLEEFANWISENPEEFADYCDRILNIVKAFGALVIITQVISWLGGLSSAVQGIGSLFSTLGPILTNPWMLVVAALATVVTTFWIARDEIMDAFKTLFEFICNPMEYIMAFIDVLDYLYSAIVGFFDKIGFKIGRWIGENLLGREYDDSGRSSGGIRIQAPHAATGAFMNANTPTLTVVGDNRRQGEFVLTEQQFAEAANKYGGGGSESVAIQREILEAIKNLDLTAVFDMDTIAKFVLTFAAKQQRATGKSAL